MALSVSMIKLDLFAFGPGKLINLRAVQMMGWVTRIPPCTNAFLQLNDGTEVSREKVTTIRKVSVRRIIRSSECQ